MSRFLVVSFAGLALAFYELSGGADFVPPKAPMDLGERTASLDTRPAPSRETSDRIALAPTETTLTSPVLTPYRAPAMASTEGSPVMKTATGQRVDPAPDRPASDEATVLHVTLREPVAADPALPVSLDLASSGLQISSLQGGLSAMSEIKPEPTPVKVAAAPEPIGDMRRIRASRANVRLGPGTQFPVMMQLLAGDQVRVLSMDDSVGWALLENPVNGQVGWIAASLLSAKGS